MSNSGLVYVFTGDGKGKTSAALGVAMRVVGHGKRVAMVQWYKKKTEGKRQKVKGREAQEWMIGEQSLPELLKKPLFEIYPMGEGFFIKNHYNQSGRKGYNTFFNAAPLQGGGVAVDTANETEHKIAAEAALELAKKLLKGKMVKTDTMTKMAKNYNHFDYSNHSSHLFLLILDEVLNAIHDGLISQTSLMSLIKERNATHIILTGRNAPKELIGLADLVTEMKNIKHPYDLGKKAVLGLDY